MGGHGIAPGGVPRKNGGAEQEQQAAPGTSAWASLAASGWKPQQLPVLSTPSHVRRRSAELLCLCLSLP